MNDTLKYEIQYINELYINIVFILNIDINTIKYLFRIEEQINRKKWSWVKNIQKGLHNIGIEIDINFINDFNEYEINELISKVENDNAIISNNHFQIPLIYNGIDIDDVCKNLNISYKVFIDLHSKPTYVVGMIGFLPGFPYLIGTNPNLHLPRKKNPSKKVPAGSVAIADIFTGIYSFESPGGWHIVGSTDVELFSINRGNFSMLKQGDTVKFIPII